MNGTIGKISRGFLFAVVLSVGILFWESRLDNVIRGLPAITEPVMGSLLVASGILLILFAWIAIIRHGKGLPLNALHSEKTVYQGVYALIPHPVHSGFAMVVAGHSILVGSAAGLWVTTPIVVLCSAALIMGYEKPDMEKRFGVGSRRVAISLPPDEDAAPTVYNRISSYALVSLPWVVLYEAIIILGPSPDAFETYFDFERALPVIEWTEIFYASTYLFVSFPPLIARRQKDLRAFMLMLLWATLLGMLCFLLLPFQATPRPFVASSVWGRLLLLEQSFDGPAGAFPSFHVIWAWLAAWLYAKRSKIAPLWYIAAAVISLSCVTTGMHSIFDIVGAAIVCVIVINGKAIRIRALKLTERLASSRREWRVGSVRTTIAGAFIGVGAFVGASVSALLTGEEQAWYVLIASFAALTGALIWGRALERSSELYSPFGYYGALIGGVLGILMSIKLGADGWLLAGACVAAAPFARAIGGIGCLERGRVRGGSSPVYLAQLYSILYKLVIGAFLIRAWTLSIPLPLIIGAYLVFDGIGRFIEEGFSGDSQTPRYAGLPVRQWFAVAGSIAGTIIMTFPAKPSALETVVAPWFFLCAAIFGIIVALVMSAGFPKSEKRFSRLD